jgi:DNA-binding NtrC family response regulator
MIQDKYIKIFIVDDEVFYLNIFKQHITNLGYQDITIFENGIDCLAALNQQPLVVFLDYKMDIISGYQVLTKIKRIDPNIFVVMISSQEEITPAIETLKHGAFDYIQKGVNEEEKIKDVLDRVLRVRELIIQNKPNFIKSIFKFL